MRPLIIALFVSVSLAAPMAHAFGLTWYFQTDAAKIAQQAKIYVTEQAKLALEEQDRQVNEQKLAEEEAYAKVMGEATEGDLSLDDLGRAERRARAQQQLEDMRAANELARRSGKESDNYKKYLERVAYWRDSMEVYRVKADAMAADVNSRKLTLNEWIAVQSQYNLLLGQLAATSAAAASDQAEAKVEALREREMLRKRLLELQQMRQR